MVDPSVRFLRVVFTDSPTDALLRHTEKNGPLAEFLSSSLPAPLVEITFFNSGEGVHYWMANPSGRPTTPTHSEMRSKVR